MYIKEIYDNIITILALMDHCVTSMYTIILIAGN